MNAVMHSGEIVALGWTLLHFCWQSTVVALLYVAADRCLVHVTTAVRYAVAMAMLGLLPLAAIATFLSQEQLLVASGKMEQAMATSRVGGFHEAFASGIPLAAPAMAGGELWIADHADRVMPWIDGLWLAGVCLLGLRAAGGWWRLRWLRRRAQLQVPEAVQQSFARVVRQLGLVQPVVLRISRDVISPMAMGVWWTTVMLPLSVITSLPTAQLEAVLAHELAHIRRWDYLCNLLQTAIECLFFFHPAVWWMSRRTRELREVCCDEIAARTCADPGVYAEALLQMEEQRAEHLQLAVALHGNGGTLLNRIRRVMGERTMEYGSISVVRVAAAGLVVAGLMLAPHVEKRLMAQPTVIKRAPGVLMLQAADGKVAVVTTADSKGTSDSEASQPAPAAAPAPAPDPAGTAIAEPAPSPVPEPTPEPEPRVEMQDTGHAGADYLEKMRAAGYPLDLNKDLDEIIALRSVGVTPEYARAMAATGMGTPTTHDLVSMRAQGITPEYVTQMKAAGLAPADLHELMSMRAVGVTPEYAKSMATAGFGTPSMHDLISMKAQGITPEYVAEMKSAGLAPADLHELISMRAVGVTPQYAKSMTDAGFTGMSTHDLVSLKAQGITPEYVRWMKTKFPNADLAEVRRAAVFHIDEDFMNKAKAHSFNSTDLDKLVKLKMTGLLD